MTERSSLYAEGFLASAVILQAFGDAGLLSGAYGAMRGNVVDREQARMFLTAEQGEWAQSREAWCTAADLEPDWVRDIARRLEKNPLARTGVARHIRQVPRLRLQRTGPTPELVAHTKTRVEYLASKGIDPLAVTLQVIIDALNAGGFTTPRGFKYNQDGASNFKQKVMSCRRYGFLK